MRFISAVFVILLTSGMLCAADDKKTDDKTFASMFRNFLTSLFGSSKDDAIVDAIGNATRNNTKEDVIANLMEQMSKELPPSTTTPSIPKPTTITVTPTPSKEAVSSSIGTPNRVTSTSRPTLTSTSRSGLTSTSSTSTTSTPGSIFDNSLLGQDRCYTEAVLQNFCAVPVDMEDVSFWDLYSVLFSDTVIDALIIGCTRGSWCLKDRFDYWEALIVERVDMVMKSEIARSMCLPELRPCISAVLKSFENCSMFQQMQYTSDALNLICGLRNNAELTSECFKHVLTGLHVSLADVMRKKTDIPVETTDKCQTPEAHMTRGLICVTNSCPGESAVFHSFAPWSWFTATVDDLIHTCDLDPAKCLALLTRTPGMLYENEVGTLVLITVATMVTAVVLALTVCTCYKRHRRHVVLKDGYQQLLNEGDES